MMIYNYQHKVSLYVNTEIFHETWVTISKEVAVMLKPVNLNGFYMFLYLETYWCITMYNCISENTYCHKVFWTASTVHRNTQMGL